MSAEQQHELKWNAVRQKNCIKYNEGLTSPRRQIDTCITKVKFVPGRLLQNRKITVLRTGKAMNRDVGKRSLHDPFLVESHTVCVECSILLDFNSFT